MTYFDEELFAFLRELRTHNDRAWFTANKERYERSVKAPVLAFVADAGPHLRKLSKHLVADPRPVGGSMFRIYRDMRFSKDTSPYKTHVGVHFPLGKGMAVPGYYLHLEPRECFVGAGMWSPGPVQLQQIRTAIAERPADWRRASGDLDPDEDALKRPPRGFDVAHPMIEDIKRKRFSASLRLSDGQVLRDDAMRTFVGTCRELAPLMRFLARAVGASW
ncbi:MAG TPA: DUF2461 domain-containing protein [Actinomycetota bacterium]|jgi:uncharacterized protein (TIGR02453 family)|nr:DUF2461 domain-containing protein [Actinomycetota bacterium]